MPFVRSPFPSFPSFLPSCSLLSHPSCVMYWSIQRSLLRTQSRKPATLSSQVGPKEWIGMYLWCVDTWEIGHRPKLREAAPPLPRMSW